MVVHDELTAKTNELRLCPGTTTPKLEPCPSTTATYVQSRSLSSSLLSADPCLPVLCSTAMSSCPSALPACLPLPLRLPEIDPLPPPLPSPLAPSSRRPLIQDARLGIRFVIPSCLPFVSWPACNSAGADPPSLPPRRLLLPQSERPTTRVETTCRTSGTTTRVRYPSITRLSRARGSAQQKLVERG